MSRIRNRNFNTNDVVTALENDPLIQILLKMDGILNEQKRISKDALTRIDYVFLITMDVENPEYELMLMEEKAYLSPNCLDLYHKIKPKQPDTYKRMRLWKNRKHKAMRSAKGVGIIIQDKEFEGVFPRITLVDIHSSKNIHSNLRKEYLKILIEGDTVTKKQFRKKVDARLTTNINNMFRRYRTLNDESKQLMIQSRGFAKQIENYRRRIVDLKSSLLREEEDKRKIRFMIGLLINWTLRTSNTKLKL